MPKPVITDGIRLPASYANFYIFNEAVLVPVFNDPDDEPALHKLQQCFPDRKLIAVDSTPERSLSLLLRTSRAAEATTGCGEVPRCLVSIIRCKVVSKGHAGSERKLATPRSVLSWPA